MHAGRLRLPQSAATIRLPLGNPDLMTLTFDHFQPGRFGTFGPRHVTREEILAFAAEFDPQPMHLDEVAANASMLKGLSGSDWHLGSIMMRMLFDGFIGRTASLGSPGVNEMRWLAPPRLVADGKRLTSEAVARGEKVAVWVPSPGFRELRWIKPVLAGDTIHFSNQIETKRTSEKRPEWGILQARNTGTNQRGEVVFSFLA